MKSEGVGARSSLRTVEADDDDDDVVDVVVDDDDDDDVADDDDSIGAEVETSFRKKANTLVVAAPAPLFMGVKGA